MLNYAVVLIKYASIRRFKASGKRLDKYIVGSGVSDVLARECVDRLCPRKESVCAAARSETAFSGLPASLCFNGKAQN